MTVVHDVHAAELVGTQELQRPRGLVRARLSGVAHHFPATRRTTAELERMVAEQSRPNFAPPTGIIEQITGIRSRYVAAPDEQASDLAAAAGRSALLATGLDAADIDVVIFAAASQDLAEPATANIVREKIGTHCPVFDVKNACNSFLNGLQIAESFIKSGAARHVLVAVGETPSRAIKYSVSDRHDFRMSFPGYTFGDAGAAVILSADELGRGIEHCSFQTESRYWSVGTLAGGGSRHPRGDEWSYFRGDGALLRDAFREIGTSILDDALLATETTLDNYRRVLVHQVTMPFLKVFLKDSGIPQSKLILTLPDMGNMAAASLPVQLSVAIERGDLASGDRVLCIGLAGGVSLAVVAIQL